MIPSYNDPYRAAPARFGACPARHEHLRCLCVKAHLLRAAGTHLRPAGARGSTAPDPPAAIPGRVKNAVVASRLERRRRLHVSLEIVFMIVDIAPNDIAPNRILTLTAAEPSARSARPAGVRARGGRPTRLPGPGPDARAPCRTAGFCVSLRMRRVSGERCAPGLVGRSAVRARVTLRRRARSRCLSLSASALLLAWPVVVCRAKSSLLNAIRRGDCSTSR